MPNDETMRSVGFAFVNETTMRCLRCGMEMPAFFASALAHNEKRERALLSLGEELRGFALSECDMNFTN